MANAPVYIKNTDCHINLGISTIKSEIKRFARLLKFFCCWRAHGSVTKKNKLIRTCLVFRLTNKAYAQVKVFSLETTELQN